MPTTSEFVVVRRGDGVEMHHGCHKDLYFPKHSHDDYSISMNYNGVESIWLDGKTLTAIPGQITAYNPGEVQSGGSDQRNGWVMRALHLDVEWVTQMLGDHASVSRGYPVFTRAVIDDADARRLLAGLTQDPVPLDPLDHRLVELVGILFDRHGDTKKPAECKGGPPGLQRAIEYMRDHLESLVSISDLTRVSGLSPSYLTRTCRALTGFPPHQLHLQMRVHRAGRLLARGGEIAEVAYRLGFSDQSHLHRQFRRVYGMTCGQYRA